MECGPPVDQGRAVGDGCQPAAGHCHRLAACARRFWGKSLLNAVVHLPLMLPPVVTGYLLLLSFGRRGRSARSSTNISASSCPSAGPARCLLRVMGFPLMVRAIRLSIEAVDRKP
jgi:molybdate transport system permease protein